jgi:ribosomal protein S18 acetylase RimI-like enzyme
MLANLKTVIAEEIYLAMESPPWGARELGKLISESSPSSLVFVVAVDDRIVGDCWMMRGKLKKTAHTCSLGMHLISEYRNLGLGSVMIEYGLSWARQAKLDKVFLSVFGTNQHAISLYSKFGFAVEGRRPHQYMIQGRAVSEVLMGLLLATS